MDDAEATIAMVDSNLQREHIKPSEKAYAYKMKLEAMKQQGKKFTETLSQVGTKLMDLEQCTPSLSQANRMKRLSQSEGLDMDKMYDILEEEKGNQREQIKIRADSLEPYFPADFTPKQKVELIEKWSGIGMKNRKAFITV